VSYQIVSLVLPYYENPKMLDIQAREWLSYPSFVTTRLRVVVVDDGSSDAPALEVLRQHRVSFSSRGLDVQLYVVENDIPWNQDGARNLGMRMCNTVFALMTDIDHLLRARDALDMVEFCLSGIPRGEYYMPRQFVKSTMKEIPRHPNTFLFRVADFWAMGGYDEDFAGWYGSDGNFRRCARGNGLQECVTNEFGLVVWRRDDCEDANTRRYGRKESEYHSHRNPRLLSKMRAGPYRAVNPIRFDWRKESL
jgi:hypothetical protein